MDATYLNGTSLIGLNSQDAAFIQKYNSKGFRLEKLSAVLKPTAIWTIFMASATGIALGATFLAITAAPWAIPVLVISSIAFAVIFSGIVICDILKLKNIADKVYAFAIDCLAALALGVLLPISQTWFDPKKKEIDKTQTPILLIHGYLHNSSGWGYFRHRLKMAGHKNIFTINLGDPFLSIETYAKRVEEKIKQIETLTGRKDVHLIGHSMGGVVSSYYATHLAPEGTVKSIQTLGTPLNGTRLKGVGMSAFQMRYQCEFIANLRKKVMDSAIPMHHVGSHSDLMIKPNASMIIEKNPHTMFSDLGHVTYLFSDKAIRSCALFLNKLNRPA